MIGLYSARYSISWTAVFGRQGDGVANRTAHVLLSRLVDRVLPRRACTVLLLAALMFEGCGGSNLASDDSDPIRLEPSQLCTDHDFGDIATFADPGLEAAVREALSVGAGIDLTCGNLDDLTGLDAASRGIQSLVGIQNLVNLEGLGLNSNSITSLAPLSGLRRLDQLSVGDNLIADLSPLAGASNLTSLVLFDNPVVDLSPLRSLHGLNVFVLTGSELSDISALSELTALTFLALNANQINDIGPTEDLTSLEELQVSFNSISDLRALERLTGLNRLLLQGNPITNIDPLVSNQGLGQGDLVDLRNTTADCDAVATLEARGVRVESGC